MHTENQLNVPDDFHLLDQMMHDLEKAPAEFKPTNYWKFYERRFVPELKKRGLKDFRRRKFSVLDSFGATDHFLKGCLSFRTPFRGHHRIAALLNHLLDRLPMVQNGLTDSSGEWITEFLYRYVKGKFERAGLDLSQCPTSPIGRPEDLVEIENGLWSSKHLNFCSIFADVAMRIPIQNDWVVCELGSGLGRNAEIMARLYKDMTLLLFDIPPQLYTANQYLKALFGDRVLPYKEALEISTNDPQKALEKIRGKICLLPTWKLPEWSHCKIDLFFNSESFQEMEREVVKNYLLLVQKMQPGYIYINAYPDGARWYTSAKLGGGQETPVSEDCYTVFLQETYELTEKYCTDKLLRRADYRSYIFKKRI